MDKQYRRPEKIEYMRMESSDFVPWYPDSICINPDLVDDLGFDLMDSCQQFDYMSLKDSEQDFIAKNSAELANKIIFRLMKGAK
jgi:hypothetical protein